MRQPDRFAFGENWSSFARRLTPARVAEAERSLVEMLGPDRLTGASFLDGRMETALERTAARVAPGGDLFVAIYNDEGRRSISWRRIKRAYNRVPARLQPLFVIAAMAPQELKTAFRSLRAGDPLRYVRTWTGSDGERGMDKWHDMVDWVGGYPFEVAGADRIFDFHRLRGFALTRLKVARRGCNQYVFSRPE